MAKHLNATDREWLYQFLNENKNLNLIAKLLGRDRKTIALEIKRNRTPIHKGALGKPKVFCQQAWDGTCQKKNVCPHCITPTKRCWACQQCLDQCEDYVAARCIRIAKSPFCCNGCSSETRCIIPRFRYSPSAAQESYQKRLKDVRVGSSFNDKELLAMSLLINEGLSKGQSIHHIVTAHRDKLLCSPRNIYMLKDKGLLDVRNIDMPRTVQRKLSKTKRNYHKVDAACHVGRSYQDFLEFSKAHPELDHVQMDTVEGVKEDLKCFLSLSFPHLQLSLFFLMQRQTAHEVTSFFTLLYEKLGEETFTKLFPVILTDRGSEFSDPLQLEKLGIKVFYCDPMASYQKGHVENQNSLFRRIVPKGYSLEELQFEDSLLINSHLASYSKKSLNDKTPYELLRLTHGEVICKALGLELIPAPVVVLHPSLLKGKMTKKEYNK